MSVVRGRVLKGDAARGARTVASPSGRAVVVPAAVVDARAEAARIVAAARAEAEALVQEARAEAQANAEGAANAAREGEIAKLAAAHLVLRAREAARAERELDQTVSLAVLLAERLVGEALAVDPSRIGVLASEVLHETRGARRLRVEVSPLDDVRPLADALALLGAEAAEVVHNPELGRGSVLVETELGRIDARLQPRLERLATALREALAAGGIGGGR